MSSARRLLLGPAVLVGGRQAGTLIRLLEPGRRQAERDGRTLPSEVVEVLEALAELAQRQRGAFDDDEHPVREWIPTAEAAVMLGHCERQVRNLVRNGRLSGRKLDGRLLIDVADVYALLSVRAEVSGTVRKPSRA